VRRLAKFGEEGFHLGAGVLVAFFGGGGDAVRKNLPGFGRAGFAGEELAVHQIGGDVVGIAIEKRAKMGVGCGRVAAVHALHGEAVAGEGVVGFLGHELFEHLAAGFLLFGHWSSRIIRERERATKLAQRRGNE